MSRALPTPGSTTATCTVPAGKVLERAAEPEPGLGRPVHQHLVREVDDARACGEAPQHLPLHDADERVLVAEVGRQRDDAGGLKDGCGSVGMVRRSLSGGRHRPLRSRVRLRLMPYLYLVRHGQPDFAGNYDSITDARRAAVRLARRAFRRAWPAVRARRVRHPAAAGRDLRPDPAAGDGLGPDAVQRRALQRVRPRDAARVLRGRHGAGAARRRRPARLLHARSATRCRRGRGTTGPIANGESWDEFGARIRDGIADTCAGSSATTTC